MLGLTARQGRVNERFEYGFWVECFTSGRLLNGADPWSSYFGGSAVGPSTTASERTHSQRTQSPTEVIGCLMKRKGTERNDPEQAEPRCPLDLQEASGVCRAFTSDGKRRQSRMLSALTSHSGRSRSCWEWPGSCPGCRRTSCRASRCCRRRRWSTVQKEREPSSFSKGNEELRTVERR